ncbi:MAG: glycosyltransferase family 2 protein [Gammaproteobacteria bacterium]
MQIIIPMAGFGSRFKAHGYQLPKPLIAIEGKPIIAHVIDMFPGEADITLICNRDHLEHPEYHMKETLETYAPHAKIIGIESHDLGPVYTVCQAIDVVDPKRPATVCYCDFTCDWDYAHFKKTMQDSECDGCVPAYRGFHPHYLITPTNYANMQEQNFWMQDIQEKQPFTDNPWEEFASSGSYYFKTGALLRHYFEKTMEDNLKVNNEFYVSMAYKSMLEDQKRVLVYELDHFMQWGTPQDFEEYEYWSRLFAALVGEADQPTDKTRQHEKRVYDYWQSFFDGWNEHPYTIDKDPTLTADEKKTQKAAALARKPKHAYMKKGVFVD